MTKQFRDRIQELISRRHKGVNPKDTIIRKGQLIQLLEEYDKKVEVIERLQAKIDSAKQSLK